MQIVIVRFRSFLLTFDYSLQQLFDGFRLLLNDELTVLKPGSQAKVLFARSDQPLIELDRKLQRLFHALEGCFGQLECLRHLQELPVLKAELSYQVVVNISSEQLLGLSHLGFELVPDLVDVSRVGKTGCQLG